MSALDRQEGGDHYKNMVIQPAEYCQKNKLGCMESFIVKYVSRHQVKNGALDLRKAKHCIDLLIEFEYGVDTAETQAQEVARVLASEERRNDGAVRTKSATKPAGGHRWLPVAEKVETAIKHEDGSVDDEIYPVAEPTTCVHEAMLKQAREVIEDQGRRLIAVEDAAKRPPPEVEKGSDKEIIGFLEAENERLHAIILEMGA